MKLSNGYILGSLGKIATNIKEKFKESAFLGFVCGKSAVNDAIDDSAVVNLPGHIKDKLSKKEKKPKEKVLAGRAPLKRAQERVGAVDAADLPKNFAYVFGGAVRESKLMALINGLWSGICNTQASLVGALLLLTSISSFAVSLIKHILKISTDADTFSLYLSIVMFVVAVFLVSAGAKSIYELFTQSLLGSEFMKNIMGVRVVEENTDEENEKKVASSPRTFVVILFCLIICGLSLWVGLERIVAASVVLALVVAILKMPESGIMMLLTAFPWIGLLENGTLILCAVSLLILFSWIFKIFVGKRVYNIRLIDIAVGMFLVLYLFAGILGKVTQDEMHTSVCRVVIATLYFPMSGLIRSSEWINRSMRAYTVGTLLVSVTGIAQFLVNNIFSTDNIAFGITSVFNNNHSLCAYLLVGIFVGIFNVAEKKDQEFSISYKASLVLNLLCLILAGSKTAYLAFIIAFLIYLLIQKPKIVAIALFCVPFIIVIWTMMPDAVNGYLDILLESTDVELRSKLYIWNRVLDAASEHLMFGIGTGISSLESVWSDCYEYLPDSLQFYNLYVSVIVQTGLIGLALLLVFIVSAVQRGFSVIAGTEHGTYFKNLSACSVCAMLSLLAFGMGNSLWQDTSLLLLFFFIVALVRCVKFVYVREFVTYEDQEILDIDVSTQRKVNKESKLLVAVLRCIAKIVKRVKKKYKSAKSRKKIDQKVDEGLSVTENGEETVQISEVDLCEEESLWQRK